MFYVTVRAVNRSFRFVPKRAVTEAIRYVLAATLDKFRKKDKLVSLRPRYVPHGPTRTQQCHSWPSATFDTRKALRLPPGERSSLGLVRTRSSLSIGA